MAKRMQEQKEEESIVAKSSLTALNLSSIALPSSSSAKNPIAAKSPGILIATGKLESRMRRNSESDTLNFKELTWMSTSFLCSKV